MDNLCVSNYFTDNAHNVYIIFIFSFFSAIVEKYLLEKSRIVSQAKNERYACDNRQY